MPTRGEGCWVEAWKHGILSRAAVLMVFNLACVCLQGHVHQRPGCIKRTSWMLEEEEQDSGFAWDSLRPSDVACAALPHTVPTLSHMHSLV